MSTSPQSIQLPPPINDDWKRWAIRFMEVLRPALDRYQRKDSEYEPPSDPGDASRLVLRDTNGARYAVTVSTAGVLVVTAL